MPYSCVSPWKLVCEALENRRWCTVFLGYFLTFVDHYGKNAFSKVVKVMEIKTKLPRGATVNLVSIICHSFSIEIAGKLHGCWWQRKRLHGSGASNIGYATPTVRPTAATTTTSSSGRITTTTSLSEGSGGGSNPSGVFKSPHRPDLLSGTVKWD